jgi:ABC-type branched-subunit amino acid transport system ATPase component/ABC-type branched-subunit amino acid transport system permease subunit
MQARSVLPVAGIAALAVFPFIFTSPYYLHLLVVIAIYSVLLLGLDIVFGYTGEVSIGHAALFGVGAYTAGVLKFQCDTHHLWQPVCDAGLFAAVPLGMVVAALFGLILALPALRVTGPYLAMVTLAFGTIVQILVNEMTWLTNGPLGVSFVKPLFVDLRGFAEILPFLDMSRARMRDVEYYYLAFIVLLLVIVAVNRLLGSHIGRAFQALRDSPIASDCMGVSVYRHKVYAFVVSAGLAGLAGGLFAYSEQYIAPNNFGFELSITFLLAVTIGGRKSRTGPIIGAIIVVFLPNLLADIFLFRVIAGLIAAVGVIAGGIALFRQPESVQPGHRLRIAIPVVLCVGFFVFALLLQRITDFRLTIFGMMILFVVYYLPDGIFGFFRRALARIRPDWVRFHAVIAARGDETLVWAGASATGGASGPLLDVRGATMQFGGLRALDSIDVSVKPETIHGLIGPNGSGKSTMMNVLTGIYRPTSGEIMFAGEAIAGLAPAEIAGRGIARTFQNVQLFVELTVIENIMVGLHHTYRSNALDIMLRTPRYRREEARARLRAASILDFVGLGGLANEEARNLPYGKQRLLEIGRALALDPKLMLLDEPAAGLTAPDIKDLVSIIRKIRDHGITVILIEHHMDVVMAISDTVTVLDFGQKIAEGRPAEVQANERVIEAYLGGAAAKVA